MKDNKTEIVGFRVTKSELDVLKNIADSHGKTLSQWCKDVIIKIANENDQQSNLLSFSEKLILEQLVLLRYILLNSLVDKQLTEDKLKRIIKKVAETKSEKLKELVQESISNSEKNIK
ncbi:MAG: hypothetical protein HYR87_07535 [Thaumarchaeota archaeon]|nr:hypothetical protein [Nitrososphaerota archaeon]